MRKLQWRDADLTQDTKFQWLGQEFFLAYNRARTLWPKRLEKAQQALRKLSQLATTPVVKQKVVERAITPLYAYGLHSTFPPSKDVKGLNSSVKMTVWGKGRKLYHCWPLACAILYRAHGMEVWSALVYALASLSFRALQDDQTVQQFRYTLSLPDRLRPRGPAQLLIGLLREVGGELDKNLWLRYDNGDEGRATDIKKTLHHLRAALRRRLLTQGMQKRKHMDTGGASIDIDRTQRAP